MMPHGAACLASAMASLSLLACAGPTGSPSDAVGGAANPGLLQTVSFANCPWRLGDGGLQLVRTSPEWERFLKEAQPPPAAVGQWKPLFDSQWVLLYAAGFKPSSGHALNIGQPVLTDGRRTVTLPVTQVSPPAGTLSATVMTSPCAVGWLQAPSAGRLRLVDAQSGTVLAEQTLSR